MRRTTCPSEIRFPVNSHPCFHGPLLLRQRMFSNQEIAEKSCNLRDFQINSPLLAEEIG